MLTRFAQLGRRYWVIVSLVALAGWNLRSTVRLRALEEQVAELEDGLDRCDGETDELRERVEEQETKIGQLEQALSVLRLDE